MKGHKMAGIFQLSENQLVHLNASLPTIEIYGDVDRDMLLYVRAAIMHLQTKGRPDIQVVISTPGGDVESGLQIYDLLRLYKGKKTAVVHIEATSMGAIILQACEVRQCAKHSKVLIHHVSRGDVILDELRSKRRLAELIAGMERNQKKLYEIIALRTGKRVPEIRRACAKDQYMNADEALEFGLIDAIV